MLIAGHDGTAALLCGAPVIIGHGKTRRGALQHHGDHKNLYRRPRRLEALRRSMATVAAMAELQQRHTRGGIRRNMAYQRHDGGRSKVGRVEQGEAEL